MTIFLLHQIYVLYHKYDHQFSSMKKKIEISLALKRKDIYLRFGQPKANAIYLLFVKNYHILIQGK